MKKRMMIISLLVGLMLASQLLAQPPIERPAKGNFPGIWSRLNFSTEQLKTFTGMRLEFQKEMLPLRTELKAKRLELESLLLIDKLNQRKIDSVIEEMGTTRTKIQKNRIAHRLAMRDQLTEEQKALWDVMPKGIMKRGAMRGRMNCCDPFGSPNRGLRGRGYQGRWW